MMTVHEVSILAGISIRTLRYYDQIGLLRPSDYTESGYRLYDDVDLKRLQQILLFKELDFSLKDIKRLISGTSNNMQQALTEQIELLKLRVERLNGLIDLAQKIKENGEYTMDFSVFDKKKINEYAQRAKAQWGDTDSYKEYEQKTANDTEEQMMDKGERLMGLFIEFGRLMNHATDSNEAQEQVKKLQRFITENYYNCTKKILSGLADMYAAGGEMTDNINRAGGHGTAQFAADAIKIYCK